MIIYATKQTIDRYGIKLPESFQDPVMRQIALDVYNGEKDNCLLEWGAKLFYFDRHKCIQICNFEKFSHSRIVSALRLFLFYSIRSALKTLLCRFIRTLNPSRSRLSYSSPGFFLS